jgi:hypothetical protein
MFRFLFRFVGWWMLAGAFVSLVIDGTRSITAGRLVLMPLAEAWVTLHAPSIDWLRQIAETDLPRWLWDSVLIYVLFAPLWAVLGVIGLIFLFIGRRPAKLIGYSSRD